MLKAFDDSDSDSETVPAPKLALAKSPVQSLENTAPVEPADEEVEAAVSDGSDEEDDILSFAPRGKMSRRMQGRVPKKVEEDEEEESDSPVTASRHRKPVEPVSTNDKDVEDGRRDVWWAT